MWDSGARKCSKEAVQGGLPAELPRHEGGGGLSRLFVAHRASPRPETDRRMSIKMAGQGPEGFNLHSDVLVRELSAHLHSRIPTNCVKFRYVGDTVAPVP